MAGIGPLTPAKSIVSSRPGSKLQDSPFSDYFTDDGRSANEDGYSAPSAETQQMLLRLNKLQSQLMRGVDGQSERETLNIVGKKLDGIELELDSLHSQTRMPPELEDSGLFLEEEEGEEEVDREDSGTPSGLGVQYDGANDDAFGEQPTKDQKRAEYDYLLVQAQQVLANVTKAQEKLKQRHAELRELNDAHTVEMDEKDREIEELKSENEAMQLDLNHDHSELLFLKLQFKALEVEFDALDDEFPARPKPAQRKKLQVELDRWRSDWHDVDGRMKRRRSHYGVVSPQSRRDSHAESGADANARGDDWQLETVTKGHGRVQSIVIRRTTSAGYPLGLDGADDIEDEPSTLTAESPTAEETACSTPKPTYEDQSTQTASVPSAWLADDAVDDEREEMPPLDDDCAITTSSEADETEYGNFVVDEEPVVRPSLAKSALQDLWEGLSSLAGMGDERF